MSTPNKKKVRPITRDRDEKIKSKKETVSNAPNIKPNTVAISTIGKTDRITSLLFFIISKPSPHIVKGSK